MRIEVEKTSCDPCLKDDGREVDGTTIQVVLRIEGRALAYEIDMCSRDVTQEISPLMELLFTYGRPVPLEDLYPNRGEPARTQTPPSIPVYIPGTTVISTPDRTPNIRGGVVEGRPLQEVYAICGYKTAQGICGDYVPLRSRGTHAMDTHGVNVAGRIPWGIRGADHFRRFPCRWCGLVYLSGAGRRAHHARCSERETPGQTKSGM